MPKRKFWRERFQQSLLAKLLKKLLYLAKRACSMQWWIGALDYACAYMVIGRTIYKCMYVCVWVCVCVCILFLSPPILATGICCWQVKFFFRTKRFSTRSNCWSKFLSRQWIWKFFFDPSARTLHPVFWTGLDCLCCSLLHCPVWLSTLHLWRMSRKLSDKQTHDPFSHVDVCVCDRTFMERKGFRGKIYRIPTIIIFMIYLLFVNMS